MSIKTNKKGDAGKLILDTLGIVVIAVLLIVFFVFSTGFLRGGKIGIKDMADKQASVDQEHNSLYSWLQKPVEIENKKHTIADLIRLSKIDNKYKEQLDSEISEFKDSTDYKIITEREFVMLGGRRIDITYLSTRFYLPANKTIIVGARKE